MRYLAALALIPLASCSWVAVQPPHGPSGGACTDTMGAPVVDLAVGLTSIAVALAATASLAAGDDPMTPDDETSGAGEAAVMFGVLGVPFTWSGLWGHGSVKRCRRAEAASPQAVAATGFYCAQGIGRASVSGCVRSEEECIQLRGVLGFPTQACAPRATAVCFDNEAGLELCFTNRDQCEIGSHGDDTACEERR